MIEVVRLRTKTAFAVSQNADSAFGQRADNWKLEFLVPNSGAIEFKVVV
jgi:hypothetical protein